MKNLKRFLMLILTVIFTCTVIEPAANATDNVELKATPVWISLSAEENSADLWTYEIDGGIYFKLRDIAAVLNETAKQFNIFFSESTHYVDLVPGESYVPVGGELTEPTECKSVTPSDCRFWVEGCLGAILAYNIDGNNYVKLSDLAASLGFNATCDTSRNSAVITDAFDAPPLTGAVIDNIGLSEAGNAYSLDSNGNVVLSYNNGQVNAVAPVKLMPGGRDFGTGMTIDEAGFYISAEKTAIAYGGTGDEPLYVITSEDMGKTWMKSEIIANSLVSGLSVGFITPNDGWLILSVFQGMGTQHNFVYRTYDGGKTWTQTGNPNNGNARVLTGAGFLDNETGFLCFRFETEELNISRTLDGGKTWEKLNISVPEGFEQYYSATPLSPVFNNGNGLLPVELQDENGNTVKIYFSSDDDGVTWTYTP